MNGSMRRRIFAIIDIDLRQSAGVVGLYALMAIGTPLLFAFSGSPHKTVFQLLFSFAVTICAVMTPFWLVAMDRIRGGMTVLWRLPVSRRDIAMTKCLEAVGINVAVTMVASLSAAAAHGITWAQAAGMLGFGVPLACILTVLTVAAYFIVNPQYAVFATIGVTLSVTLGFLAAFSSLSSFIGPTAICVAYLTAGICFGVTVVVLAEVLSSVNDPRG